MPLTVEDLYTRPVWRGFERVNQERSRLDTVAPMPLQEPDFQLVEALRTDGRASFKALAAQVGLSRKATHARILRLFQEGVVRVVATVPPEYDDINVIAHISIVVTGVHREEVAYALAEHPEAVFVSIVSGQANIVAEVRTSDLVRLAAIVDRVRGLHGVARVETLVYAHVLRESHLPPAWDRVNTTPPVDEVDRRLIQLLRADGRASYVELASNVGLSAAAIRVRVRTLQEVRAIRIVALVNPTKLGHSLMTGFAIDIDGPADTALAPLREIAGVDFLARTLGHSDAVGTIVTKNVQETIEVFDRIAALDRVTAFRSWTHLRLVKERYSGKSTAAPTTTTA